MNDEVFAVRYSTFLVRYSLFLFGSGSARLGCRGWKVMEQLEMVKRLIPIGKNFDIINFPQRFIL